MAARQILQNQNQSQQEFDFMASGHKAKAAKVDTRLIEKTLRKRRSKDYMAAMTGLDAGGHTSLQQQADEIAQMIDDEFGLIVPIGFMLGVVGKCYLGEPYEVHSLDMLDHQIIEHFKRGEPLPDRLEKARGLAISGRYDFIEVYEDYCCAVGKDGSVAIVRDDD